MTRYLLTAGAAVIVGTVTTAGGNAVVPYCGASASAMPAARPYVATRRLEATIERSGKQAWLEVQTTFDGRRLEYQVLKEGGSDSIRDRALYSVLKREKELVDKGTPVHMPALLADYQCADPQPEAEGLMRVAIQPREPSRHLVNGSLLVEPGTGSVVRVAGRLSKSPSFWVSDVQMDWAYERLAGVVMPVSVHARARVKIVGPSTFDMTYRYVSIDGQPVGMRASAAGPEGPRH